MPGREAVKVLKLLRYELYKTVMSRTFLILFALLLIMSLWMFGFGVGNRTVKNVLVIDTDGLDPGLADEIRENINQNGYMAFITDDKLRFSEGADWLFKPGGGLYEKYKGSSFIDKIIPMQSVESDLYSMDETNIMPKWAVTRITGDVAAIFFSAIIFSSFFLGRDFGKRYFNGPVYFGKGKGEIFAAKLSVYFIFALLLSLAELILAAALYIPDIEVLSPSFVLQRLALRLCMDIGAASLPVIFPFVFRNVTISMVSSLLALVLFVSNRAIIDLNPYQYVYKSFTSPVFNINTLYQTAGISAAIIIVSIFVSYLLFRRTELR